MKHADITVIVLTCNRDRYVREALESLRAQTRGSWELLLSDTSDEPAARAGVEAAFREHNEASPLHGARLLHPGPRLPQAKHLEAAWAHVRTPFIALLDDDDVWMPTHLERSRAWLDASERRGLSVANSVLIGEYGHAGPACHPPSFKAPEEGDTRAMLDYVLRYPFSSTSGIVLRTSALAAHRFHVSSCVDVHLSVSALLGGASIGLLAEPTFYYRVHSGSAYAKGPQAFRDRHALRLHLALRSGLALTRRLPVFPLLALKSASYLTADLGNRILGKSRSSDQRSGPVPRSKTQHPLPLR